MSRRGTVTPEPGASTEDTGPRLVKFFGLMLIVLVLFMAAGFVSLFIYLDGQLARQDESATRQRRIVASLVHQQNAQKDLLTKVNEVVEGLQRAEADRDCQAAANTEGLATVLDLLGDFAGTAPYPDPERKKVVDGFHQTAQSFRNASPTPCPGG